MTDNQGPLASDLEAPTATLDDAVAWETRLSETAEGREFLPPKDIGALDHRLRALNEVRGHEPGSHGRARAVEQAAKFLGMTARNVRRLLHRQEAHGDNGLNRQRPKNAGQRRRYISNAFDRAVVDKAKLPAIRDRLEQEIKSLWASQAYASGTRRIASLARGSLKVIAAEAGLELPETAFSVSRRYVHRFASYAKVGQRRFDRRGYADQAPRIRRRWLDYDPMETVVVDVKVLDFSAEGGGGARIWPRIVAFLDAGTGRLFTWLVWPKEGERGVRQEHVAEAFIAMATNERWGMPKRILCDNGRENGILEHLRGPLAALSGSNRVVIRSRPYAPQSKPVEAAFARFDHVVTQFIEGYAGPNRMVQKTATFGRPPPPYPGGEEELRSLLADLTEYFNTEPSHGELGGRSPEEVLADKLGAGWRPDFAAVEGLDHLFSEISERKVTRGRVSVGGERYTHPALDRFLGQKVQVAEPWRRGRLPLFRTAGGTWQVLNPEPTYAGLDPAGASAAHERRLAHGQEVSRLAREVVPIDVAQRLRHTRSTPITPMPKNSPRPPVDLGDEVCARTVSTQKPSSHPPAPRPTSPEQKFTDLERLERALSRRT